MSVCVPFSLVEDSKLLLALQENDEGFTENILDERVLSAIKTVSPLYENDGYERGLDIDALILLIEEMNYLGCARLEEVLVMAHFKFSNILNNIKCQMNDDIQRIVDSFKYESTEIRTFISYGMLSAINRYHILQHYVFTDYDFSLSCEKGHLSVAQLLHGFDGINIHADDDYAFRCACGNGHQLVAQWLYSQGDVNTHSCNDYAFRYACFGGHFSLAEWLYSLGGIDILACKFEVLRLAKYHKNSLVAEWVKQVINE